LTDKKAIVTRTTILFTFLLFAGTAHSVQAQPFKVGDYVDVQAFSQWIPGRVFKLVLYGPGGQCEPLGASCSTIGAYIVTYVVNPASGPTENMTALADVRARVPTAEDKRVEAETSAALARQPHGNTLGAKYGTRDPRTCSSRTAPIRGAPTADQAAQYVVCEMEQGDGGNPLSLVTNVKVQVASVSHAPTQLINTPSDIDPRQPVWDLRGSFTSYSCASLGSLLASNDFARTHNCNAGDAPNATGYCYKNTFGDWHCALFGAPANERTHVLPPAGY
jgi:hypothetical protein